MLQTFLSFFPQVSLSHSLLSLSSFFFLFNPLKKERKKTEKKMGTKTPVFPIPQQSEHFNDYGFDPQMDYLQVLEEAKKHKRESSKSIEEALHFKLQKPISKDDSNKKKKKNKWWINALHYCKKKLNSSSSSSTTNTQIINRANYRGGTVSGPVYITESRSGSSTPCRTSSRPTSGPLSWTLTPTRKGAAETSYVCLRELNMDELEENRRISTTAMPIYLVT